MASQSQICRRSGETSATLLLARQVGDAALPGQKLVELGCGCGAGVVHVACRDPSLQVDGLEVQAILVAEARKKILAAALAPRVRIVHGDVRQLPVMLTANGYHHVFCNPPFRPLGGGRLPPDPVRAAARFECHGQTGDFITCGRHLLLEQGFLHMIHLPERTGELLAVFRQNGFGRIVLRAVARWVLWQATSGGEFQVVWQTPLREGSGAQRRIFL